MMRSSATRHLLRRFLLLESPLASRWATDTAAGPIGMLLFGSRSIAVGAASQALRLKAAARAPGSGQSLPPPAPPPGLESLHPGTYTQQSRPTVHGLGSYPGGAEH